MYPGGLTLKVAEVRLQTNQIKRLFLQKEGSLGDRSKGEGDESFDVDCLKSLQFSIFLRNFMILLENFDPRKQKYGAVLE